MIPYRETTKSFFLPFRVFLASLICHDDASCPFHVKALSVAQHSLTILYVYFGILVLEVMPMGITMEINRALKVRGSSMHNVTSI